MLRESLLFILVVLLPLAPTFADDPPKSMTHDLVGKLVLIPEGSFQMGSNDPKFANERPRHTQRVERAFYIGIHEVTFGQFRQFVSATEYKADVLRPEVRGQGFDSRARDLSRPKPSPYTWRNTGYKQTDSHPVVNVSWNDAQAFCRWVTDRGKMFCRLPTEAEWEYACRAGTKTQYYWGNYIRKLATKENVADASLKLAISDRSPVWKHCVSFNDRHPLPAPVGSYKPNAFGLYDMHGNVSEWCEDFYVEDRYLKPESFRALTGRYRVYRGGSFFDTPDECRSAKRQFQAPDVPLLDIGFRVVLEPR
ncbi:MAG: formylglycine-generating enzyme family protein [Planctomycetes bacterium]|nr:formylglycine-generating enzyme family protein [Planctomycetota bacterium]